MAIYAIGDVQGCYTELCRLLEKIKFDEAADTLWFCGDLVNRGPQSLQTLRFVKSLGSRAITVLGNHDLHLLAIYHGVKKKPGKKDSLYALLNSPECDELMTWLQSRPMLHYDASMEALLVHAGVHPAWNLAQAKSLAQELETVLGGDASKVFFQHMYGDQPDVWSDGLEAMDRWRCITNVFTRMRFFDAEQKMNFSAKGSPTRHAAEGLTPWFDLESALAPQIRVLFGHWSTLAVGSYGRHLALDGGCVWGGRFAALRIDNAASEWFYYQCSE